MKVFHLPFFQLLLNCEITSSKKVVIFHAKTLFDHNQKALKKLMMLLRRWAGGGVYWRKRKRSFCHLINGILMIADSQLTRKAPASYSDGVYRMSGHSRPSPRSISQELMKGSDGLASRRNRTALHTFFGKFPFHFNIKKVQNVNLVQSAIYNRRCWSSSEKVANE